MHVADRRFTIMGKQPWYMKRLGPGAKWNTFRNMLADLIFQGDLQGKMYDDPEGVKKVGGILYVYNKNSGYISCVIDIYAK